MPFDKKPVHCRAVAFPRETPVFGAAKGVGYGWQSGDAALLAGDRFFMNGVPTSFSAMPSTRRSAGSRFRSRLPVLAAVVLVASLVSACSRDKARPGGGAGDGGAGVSSGALSAVSDNALVRALALTAEGVWLSGEGESSAEESSGDFGDAVMAFREAAALVPAARAPARQLAALLEDFDPAGSAKALLVLARETDSADDWLAAMLAATDSAVPEEVFLEAAVAFERSQPPPAPAPRGLREALLAKAWLERDPGSDRGPRFFRQALELASAAPGKLRPDMLYAALSEILREGAAPLPVRAAAALRIERALRDNMPDVFRSECLAALSESAEAWLALGVAATPLAEALRERLDETALFFAKGFSAALHSGDALYEAGDVVGALRAWKDALDDDPPCAPVLANNIAYVSAISGGDLDDALRFADIAVSAHPTNPTALDTLAWIFHLRGDAADAAITMRKTLKCGGFSSHEICAHASEIAAAAGNRSAAKHWRERAAELRSKRQ